MVYRRRFATAVAGSLLALTSCLGACLGPLAGEAFAQKEKGIEMPSSIEAAQETAPASFPGPSAPAGDQDRKPSAEPAWQPPPAGLEAAGVQTLLYEGFEGVFPGSWFVFDNDGATNGEVYWDDTNYRSYAGSWSGGCADGGTNASAPGTNYSNNMSSWMIYGPLDLSGATAGSLSFRYWNRSEAGFDYFKYMVSINGVNFYGYQTSGDSNGWQSATLDLANVPNLGSVLGQPQVWVAFLFTSDSSITYEGAYVDEVLVQKTFGSGSPDIRIDPLTLNLTQPSTNRPIYVELDWMEDGTHSHRPSQAVVDRIVQSFAAAGFDLHLDVSNAIPHQSTIAINGSPSGSTAVQSLMTQYFNHSADSRYYYSIWGHNYSYNGSFTTSSGIADLPGRVHLVTLGSFSGQTGTFSNQVGTFIHEFGHNLGQRHGGIDHENYKPNYLSVMNYYYQLDGLGPTLLALGFANTASGFDDFGYSHGLMPSLNESNLDETFGIGLGRGIDWNCSGSLTSGIAKDIQDWNYCGAAGPQSVISDYDNWASLASQIQLGASLTGLTEPTDAVPCITPEEHEPIAEKIAALRAAGVLPPDGPGAPPPMGEKGNNARSFFLYNDGGTPLTITAMSLDVATPWIRWEPQAPFSIAPGRSQEVMVFADFGQAPAGQTTRRILVSSNDPDESPYAGGVNLVITMPASAVCYALTRSHSGSGADPVALPASSSGCSTGQYHAGEVIQLTASPAAGWTVAGWTGTSNNASTSTLNTLTMPANAAAVSVQYLSTGTNPAMSFYTVTPCRVLDTRAGSALASQVLRSFQLTGLCGIPVTAKAVSVNLTVTQPTALGHVSLWPGNLQQPAVSAMNFSAGQTRANNAILGLATNGEGTIAANSFLLDGGSLHLLVDVNGYFQ